MMKKTDIIETKDYIIIGPSFKDNNLIIVIRSLLLSAAAALSISILFFLGSIINEKLLVSFYFAMLIFTFLFPVFFLSFIHLMLSGNTSITTKIDKASISVFRKNFINRKKVITIGWESVRAVTIKFDDEAGYSFYLLLHSDETVDFTKLTDERELALYGIRKFVPQIRIINDAYKPLDLAAILPPPE